MNVKLLKINVMKRNLFKLMMIVGLIALANTTFGQAKSVTIGKKYSYTLSDVQVLHLGTTTTADAARVDIVYENGGTNATIDNIAHDGDALAIDHATSGKEIVITTAGDLTFDVDYGEGPDATSGDLRVTVTDGGTAGCSNTIILTITVLPKPSLLAAMSGTLAFCQDKGTATDNEDAAGKVAAGTAGELSNTLTLTLDLTASNPPTDYSGTIDISFTDLTGTFTDIEFVSGPTAYAGGLSGTMTWDETSIADAEGDFVFRFSTVEGITHTAFTGTISNAKITDNDTNLAETAEYTDAVPGDDTATITINTMPKIGTFN